MITSWCLQIDLSYPAFYCPHFHKDDGVAVIVTA